jgi:hypothetical protein
MSKNSELVENLIKDLPEGPDKEYQRNRLMNIANARDAEKKEKYTASYKKHVEKQKYSRSTNDKKPMTTKQTKQQRYNKTYREKHQAEIKEKRQDRLASRRATSFNENGKEAAAIAGVIVGQVPTDSLVSADPNEQLFADFKAFSENPDTEEDAIIQANEDKRQEDLDNFDFDEELFGGKRAKKNKKKTNKRRKNKTVQFRKKTRKYH